MISSNSVYSFDALGGKMYNINMLQNNKISQTEWLRQHKFIFLNHSRVREEQDQGISQSCSWCGLFLAFRCCLLVVSPMEERASTLLYGLVRTLILGDQCPSLITSFNLN